MQKEINISLIGKVLLKKSKRAKHLSIRIKPNEGISVTIPRGIPFFAGERFAISKKDWILKHLPKIKAIENSVKIFDEQTEFKTRNHQLVIKRGKVKKVLTSINQSIIEVLIPEEIDIKEAFAQDTIKSGIVETLRIEAKDYIPQRVKMFAEEFGFKYNKLFFKNVKTRWGSCSIKNNINFNIHLMRLPERLIDYVILHELTHTIHKNHSKKFWDALERVLPNSKKLDKELNSYSSQRY